MFLIALLLTMFVSCSDDDKVPADANDNFITAFSLVSDGTTYDAKLQGNDIIITIPYNVDLNGATAKIVYTPSAKIMPDPATVTEWENDMVFQVTSFNGDVNKYTYKVVKTEIESSGNVVLNTQQEVDAFKNTDISVVKGNLVIGKTLPENATAITNLTGLEKVKQVSGYIEIGDKYQGTTVDGLNPIQIGGLIIGTQDKPCESSTLYRLKFDNLEISDGDITINNSTIQFIEFEKAATIKGNLFLNTPALQTLSCPSLHEVAGDFNLQENIETPLADFTLPELVSVDGVFSMIRSNKLESIRLPKLQTAGSVNFLVGWGVNTLLIPELSEVNGDLYISSAFESTVYAHKCNTLLEKIDGLEKLTKVKGSLTISCFDALVEFPNLHSLTTLGALKVGVVDGLFTKDVICDLSNVTFESFNGQQPAIRFFNDQEVFSEGSGKTGGYFKELRTKDDLSNVDIVTAISVTDEGLRPKLNVKKVKSLTSTVTMTSLSKDKSIPFTIEETIGNLQLVTSGSNSGKIFNLSNLKSVNGYCFITFLTGQKLDLSNLEQTGGQLTIQCVGTKELVVSKLHSVCCAESPSYKEENQGNLIRAFNVATNISLDLPELETVGSDGIYFQNFSSLNCPKLTSTARIELNGATKCTELSFPSLTKLNEVRITRLTQLTDFTTFGKFIQDGQIAEDKWSVTSCKYNPTYQDMKDGKYKPAE